MKNKSIFILLGFIAISIAIISIFAIFVNGNVKTVNSPASIETTASLSCTIENFTYPFFTYDKSNSKSVDVSLLFNNGELSSISLTTKMQYNSDKEANISSSQNHAAMNMSFGQELGADALSANYSNNNNTFRMSIYANMSQYNDDTKKYFLVETSSENINDFEYNYVSKEFNCKKNI